MLETYSVCETARLMKMPKSTVQDIKRQGKSVAYATNSTRRPPNQKGADWPLTYPPTVNEELSSSALTMREVDIPVSVDGLKENWHFHMYKSSFSGYLDSAYIVYM